jgi:CRISPR-associated endonuclease/helicase Cas3
MIYWAKTGGKITLEAHVQHLYEERDVMLPYRAFVVQKYHERTGRHLDKMLHRSIFWHDEGKKDSEWQKHCRSNSLHLAKVRHELVSLVEMHHAKSDASPPVRAAIAAHHGKLGRKHEERWQERPEFTELKLWSQFREMGDRADGLEEAIRKRYEFDGPRSWLQMVDHRASAKEGGATAAEFRLFSYEFRFNTKRGVQKEIEKLWDEPFAILRAPTGAGKTDAALLWAKHQIDCGRADRLIIAMPTRFTANALAISKPEEISSSGLYHSTSRFVHRDRALSKQDPQAQQQADSEQDMARLLEAPITVTTLDHLCICLTATREDHHGIFFNLAHSCVVIDEADFYDDFTQQNMVILLNALRLLDVRVLLMSATVPDSARQLYAASGFTVPEIYEDTSDSDRVRCRLTRLGKVVAPDNIKLHLERALDCPTIIYANTVRRAQAYYNWFKERDPEFTKANVVLYHSRFTEPDKSRKEQLLIDMLGKDAWKAETAHGIAILTQIGELSVNISADYMISDLCPIDRLAQRVGRLARFHENGGDLFLVEPCYINKSGEALLYPAPYGEWKGGWIASQPLLKSDETLTDGEYTARRFVNLVDALYPTIETELPERIRNNRRELQNLIEINWLLLPAEASAKQPEPLEEDRTERWFSRDVPPQRTLYVNYKPTGVEAMDGDDEPRTWGTFRQFKLQHGVQCHVYEFNKAVEAGLLQEARDKTVFVLGRDHNEDIWTVPKQYYDFETGLHLTEESD